MKIIIIALVMTMSFNVLGNDKVFVNIPKASLNKLEKLGFKFSDLVKSFNEDVQTLKMRESLVPALSSMLHQINRTCGGFTVHETLEDASRPDVRVDESKAQYRVKESRQTAKYVSQVSDAKIESTIRSLSDFKTRYYDSATGVQSMAWIYKKWENLTANRNDVSMKYFSHKWKQPSIILTIKGSTSPAEVVVIGGHGDSISSGFGSVETKRAPGADDNASGIATITEALRILMNNSFKPKRTIKFMAYAAEEVGLRGSAEIAKQFKNDNVNVVGAIQFDMTNFKGSDKSIHLVDDHTSSSQNKFIGEIIDTFVKVPWGYTRCGYACSDHASWTKNGFRASFPFEAAFNDKNRDIHSINDTIDKSNGNAIHAVDFAKLAVAYATQMGL